MVCQAYRDPVWFTLQLVLVVLGLAVGGMLIFDWWRDQHR